MKRDMDLIRLILMTIEDQYEPGEGYLFGLTVDGYDMKTTAEHCELLFQQGLVTFYKAQRGNDTILDFQVGNLTGPGYDYLELIRNDEIWEKTKAEVNEKKLPKTVKFIAEVAGTFVGNMMKGLTG